MAYHGRHQTRSWCPLRANTLPHWLLVGLLTATVAPVRAEDSKAALGNLQRFRAHVETGLRLFHEQRFDEAIREYLSALKINNNPVLFFNIAQANRKAGHFEEALRAYEQFRAAAPDDPLVPEAEAHANAVRANLNLERLEAERATAEHTARVRAQEAERLAALNDSLRKKYDEQLMQGEFSQKRRSQSRRVAIGVAVGSVAAAALGLGLGLGLGLPKTPDRGLGILMVIF